REVAILLCAVASIAASPPASAQASEPSVVDGVVNFFRKLFSTDGHKAAGPAAAPAPAAPPNGAPGAGEPKDKAQAEGVKPSPIALVAPTSLHVRVARGHY